MPILVDRREKESFSKFKKILPPNIAYLASAILLDNPSGSCIYEIGSKRQFLRCESPESGGFLETVYP
jgi:hypothetical protein